MIKRRLKPGESTGSHGGIYKELNTRGNETGRFVTIADNKSAPPTQKSGYTWEIKKRTPDNK